MNKLNIDDFCLLLFAQDVVSYVFFLLRQSEFIIHFDLGPRKKLYYWA